MATATAPTRSTETSSLAKERPWTPGSVWMIEFVRVKPGQDLSYGAHLDETWKKAMEEHKKNGLVLSYKILGGPPSNRDDFTHLLMIEFPNFAALDQQDKMDASLKKVFGSVGSWQETVRKRDEMRESIGAKLMREMRFK